jgi:hypothetical protein
VCRIDRAVRRYPGCSIASTGLLTFGRAVYAAKVPMSAVPHHLLAQLGLTLQLSNTLHQVLREFNQPPSIPDHRQPA